jgi:hypothetical protein
VWIQKRIIAQIPKNNSYSLNLYFLTSGIIITHIPDHVLLSLPLVDVAKDNLMLYTCPTALDRPTGQAAIATRLCSALPETGDALFDFILKFGHRCITCPRGVDPHLHNIVFQNSENPNSGGINPEQFSLFLLSTNCGRIQRIHRMRVNLESCQSSFKRSPGPYFVTQPDWP